MFRELTAVHVAGSTFWDIGYHSLSFAALGGEGCRVLAFEPNPFNRERLARNLELNPELARRIEVLPIAVAARDGGSFLRNQPGTVSAVPHQMELARTTPRSHLGASLTCSRQSNLLQKAASEPGLQLIAVEPAFGWSKPVHLEGYR